MENKLTMNPDDIKDLLPQREPFLFVKEILAADREKTVGLMTYDAAFPYYLTWSPQRKIVPEAILIESLVQCGGAGIVRLGLTEKALWGLASLEKVQIFGVVKPNSTVKLVVQNVKISNRLLKQSGVCFYEDSPVLQASWLCLRFR